MLLASPDSHAIRAMCMHRMMNSKQKLESLVGRLLIFRWSEKLMLICINSTLARLSGTAILSTQHTAQSLYRWQNETVPEIEWLPILK